MGSLGGPHGFCAGSGGFLVKKLPSFCRPKFCLWPGAGLSPSDPLLVFASIFAAHGPSCVKAGVQPSPEPARADRPIQRASASPGPARWDLGGHVGLRTRGDLSLPLLLRTLLDFEKTPTLLWGHR